MKQALFNVEELVDYLLFRLNRRYTQACARGDPRLPAYTTLMAAPAPTDDVQAFLMSVAERAPGARQRGGGLSSAVAAEYVLAQFRRGLLGPRELDLALDEDAPDGTLDTRVVARLEAHVLCEPPAPPP